MEKWTSESIADQRGRVAVVTGANSGIGFEAARELARKGAAVVLACRSEARGDDAVKRIREEQPEADVRMMALDLSDLDQVREFAERMRSAHDRLDLLINNAGVMMPPLGRTKQGFELQFGVNHLGHFALTAHLIDRVLATPKARVVNISSQAHRQGAMNFSDLNWERRSYSKVGAYGQSKLANLLFTFELRRRLEAAHADAIVTAAHPGWTSTNLQQHVSLFEFLNGFFAMKAPQGALPTLRAATDPGAKSGDYFGPHGVGEMRGYPKRVGTTRAAKSAADAATLWERSVELTNVTWDPLDTAAAA